MADSAGPLVGIDLGTTTSSLAFLNAYGRAEVLPVEDGARSLPSAVYFPPRGGAPLVGHPALERAALEPERVARFVKRDMGDPDWRFEVDGKALRPQTISALVLRALLDRGEDALGERPAAAVVTCPAYFGDAEREATAEAAALADLELLALINEPTAAALAYGLHHAARREPVRALVYDLGGGTFDVTALELLGRRVHVLATAGEHRLGGKDWDDELVNFVADEFVAAHGSDPRDDLGALADLQSRCEALKIALSRRLHARVFCRADGKTLQLDLTREQFERLTRPLLLQTRTYVDEVLSRAGLSWDAIDVVIPAGGSSHMPQVGALLRELSGRDPERTVDPELAVAQGAAYYAALVRAEQGFEVSVLAPPRARAARDDDDELPLLPGASLDAVPELLGLPGQVAAGGPLFAPALPGAVGERVGAAASAPAAELSLDFIELIDLAPAPGAAPRPAIVDVAARALAVLVQTEAGPRARTLIPAGSALPSEQRGRFVTVRDGQTAVKVVVLEGEDPDPAACRRLGECVIDGLPPRPRGQEIEVRYRLLADGRVRVEATDLASRRAARVELRRGGALDPPAFAAARALVAGRR